MKKIILTILAAAITLASCSKADELSRPSVNLKVVVVQVELPEDQPSNLLSGIDIKLTSGEMAYDSKTDEVGKAEFKVPSGVYSVFATGKTSSDNELTVLNGSKEEVVVDDNWDSTNPIIISLVASKSNQIVIKEIYVGGLIDPVTEKNYLYDSYFSLYNNSPVEANLKNLAFAIAPGASNKVSATMWGFIDYKGEQSYASEDWIPLQQCIWYFQNDVIMPPYSQIDICIAGAINHKVTFPQAIDMSNVDYVTYDPEGGMDHGYFYPAPSENIPSSHYCKTVLYGQGFGWMIPIDSPALIIFSTHGQTPEAWAKSDATTVYPEGLEDDEMFVFKRLPRAWVIDAVEVFDIDHADDDIKRLTPDLDGGYIYHQYSKGYAIYRNVDKEATEAYPANAGKLSYDYSLGTAGSIPLGSTDPSEIDAEASMRNGAKIIYKDTNNSTNDFHLRVKPSLKDID